MKNLFKTVDHTADIGIVAYGSDLPELMKSAAVGMLSLVTDLDKIEKRVGKEIVVQGGDNVMLLVGWLNELLYELDAERIIFSDFAISVQDGCRLIARCRGDKLDRRKYHIRREIKAATYHNLEIVKKASGYSAAIIFDI